MGTTLRRVTAQTMVNRSCLAGLSGVTAIAAGPFHTVALIGGVLLLPSLKARPNGNELILSWPTNARGVHVAINARA